VDLVVGVVVEEGVETSEETSVGGVT